MKKILPALFLFAFTSSYSQSAIDTINTRLNRIDKILRVLHEFRIVAYIQTEWQRADTAGAASYAGGNFPLAANNRFMVRRGRFIMSYEHRNAKDIKVIETVYAFDATERGFVIKDMYGKVTDPWIGWFSLLGGSFRHQFGFETAESPAFSESPEISRMNQTIFPNDYELGENLIVESPTKFKPLSLRIDAGLVNGEGIGVGSETGTYQSRKDFSGRIQISRRFEVNHGVSLRLSASGSYYNGGVLQTTKNVFALEPNDHSELVYTNIADSTNVNKKYYSRDYYGAHLQFEVNYLLGATMIRGEYIQGQQPGTATGSSVPTGVGNAPPGVDLYLRKFNGAMFYFMQTFKHKVKGHEIAHDITFKFDWYNPNTQIAQKNLSSAIDPRVSGADVLYRDYGLGYVFRPADWFKLMVWYDIVKNPDTEIKNYTHDLKDNVLTLRTQFYIDTWWFNKN